ncbi:hypothetical protein ANN_25315 [Periplaneta americana]|uniref:Uncharacterized protein n=1 Tax=Periplaneta americana TaxID=6978 RepID=A0ABQ8S1C0_PERAM|nr:hypothetical protein ANN_25315 [Periplaneta americana]
MRRVDILAYNADTKQGIIVDPTIRFEVECHQSAEVHLEKKSIYEPTVNYFKFKYALIHVEVFGLLIGARGTIPVFFEEFRRQFALPTSLRDDIVIIVANHMNKGKQQQRDRRKLREKRRSTGVVHLPSTEAGVWKHSTGGSTGEDEDETQTAETRRNTQHNEQLLDREPAEDRLPHKTYPQRRNKSPSDLEADDEDNQEFDSLNQSDSTVSSLVHVAEAPCRPRPGTPTGDNPDELLERAQEENRRLLSLLEDRDRKIATLEARISQLQREMSQEKDRLREENAALIRAMASLATAK